MKTIHIAVWYSVYVRMVAGTAELDVLATFLADDVGDWAPGWKEWFDKPEYTISISNRTSVTKEQGKICIRDLFTEKTEPYFETTPDQFIQMINQWEQICKQKPKEIIVSEENGLINMKGIFENPCCPYEDICPIKRVITTSPSGEHS